MNIKYYIIIALFIYQICVQNINGKIVNITVTSANINISNFRTILNSFLLTSKCPSNYSVNILPFNQTVPFGSPINQNIYFPQVHLAFGPVQYFTPSFFGFNPTTTIFKFPNAYIQDSYMNLSMRLQLMLTAVNSAVANDADKIVVFILNGSNIDPVQPWKVFNPMPFLSSFKGGLNIKKYYNSGDGINICSGIFSSGTITIAMDLNRAGTLDVLNACNAQNLFHWKMRWLIFFSTLSFAQSNIFGNIPFRQNVTIYDFTNNRDYSTTFPGGITDEQDIVLSDIAYTVVKMMDYSECDMNPGNTMNLGTGQFSFNNGIVTRTNWILDIFRQSGVFLKVGQVNITKQVISLNQPSVPLFNVTTQNLLKEMQARPFRVAVFAEKPFAYYIGNNTAGHSIDIISLILRNLNVTYNITYYNYSNGILIDGKLTGMLGLAQNGQADIVIGPITQNLKYASYVDFTDPVGQYFIAIGYKTNASNAYSQMFEFINAFHWITWTLIIASCIIYSIALTLVNMISPSQAHFNILYSLLLTMGSMVQGVTTALPDTISGRILIVFWWIFNIAILLAYVANYGAYLTKLTMQSSIQQVGDLVAQTKYAYGTIVGSAIDSFLQTSTSTDFLNANKVIRSQYLNIMPNSLSEAINLVNSTPYALIYHSTILPALFNSSCFSVSTGTDSFNYSYALPFKSDYTAIINAQINSINASFFNDLRNKYFPIYILPICDSASWIDLVLEILGQEFLTHPINSLNINKTAGIFIVMIFGIIVALFCALIELIVRKHGKEKPISEDSEE